MSAMKRIIIALALMLSLIGCRGVGGKVCLAHTESGVEG